MHTQTERTCLTGELNAKNEHDILFLRVADWKKTENQFNGLISEFCQNTVSK